MVTISIFWIALLCLITLLLRIVFEVLSSFLLALWDSGWKVALIGGISVFLTASLIFIFEMSVGETNIVNGIFFIILTAIACVVVTLLLIALFGIGALFSQLFEYFGDFFRNRFEVQIKNLTKKLKSV